MNKDEKQILEDNIEDFASTIETLKHHQISVPEIKILAHFSNDPKSTTVTYKNGNCRIGQFIRNQHDCFLICSRFPE